MAETTSGLWSPTDVYRRVNKFDWAVPPPNVFNLITPTSISVGGSSATVSMGTFGSVEFSLATTLDLNGVFSNDYKSYQIIMTFVTSAADQVVSFRLLTNGNESNANYRHQRQLGAGSTLTTTSSGTSACEVAYGGTLCRSGFSLQLNSPFQKVPTTFTSQVTSGRDVSPNVAYYATWGYHSPSGSYDGIRFFNSSTNTFTGYVSVYGLAT